MYNNIQYSIVRMPGQWREIVDIIRMKTMLRVANPAGTLLAAFLLATYRAKAHCPLCTAGIAAVAGGAAFIGVKSVVIGLFVGAFAVSTGLWIGNSKGLGQITKLFLALASYLLTVIPLSSVIHGVLPVYISLTGDYGSMLNRTYLFNSFLVGSVAGGLVTTATPWISRKITELRNGRRVPFQGFAITISLLIAVGLVMQGIVWEMNV